MMTYVQGNISEENLPLVKELFSRLGGDLKEVKTTTKKNSKTKNSKKEEVPFDYLFGKWPDFEIDARELRKRTWTRNK